MKTLTFLMFLCFITFYSCKKSTPLRTIHINVVDVPFQAEYGINVKEPNGNVLLQVVQTTDQSFDVTAKQGETVDFDYSFLTNDLTKGQGKLFVFYGTDTLYRATGGSSDNVLIKIP